MNSHIGYDWDPHGDLVAQLLLAQSLVAKNEPEAATWLYRAVLLRPDLEKHQDLHAEVLANLGALLLQNATDPVVLTESIRLLSESRNRRRGGSNDRSHAIADTNLALAYIRRFQANGERGDAFAAHFTLDGVQALPMAQTDPETLDWIRSVRDLLVEALDRRSKSRPTDHP